MREFNSVIQIKESIEALDWVIFSFVIFATIISIFYGHILKKQSVTDENSNFLDHLIMGRRLTLPIFVATLVSTWYGGIFGVTQIAFERGIYNFITQGFFWYFAYIIFALFLVDRIGKFKAVTLPDLVGQMFGPKAMRVSAVFNFFNVLPIAYVISIGLFLELIFGIEKLPAMSIGVSMVIIYAFLGGFRAEVFSDLVQFFVMCAGVAVVLLFSINEFGGISFLKANLPAEHFSLTGGGTIAETLVWGFIALSTLVDPNFYQRCFAATSTKVAKRGILISTIIWFLFDICTTFGAMYARAVIPEAESGKAYLIYALQLLPDGFRGLFLAGILATIISTLDSFLFLAATTLAYDLAPKKYQSKMWLHHLSLIFVGVLTILLALHFEGNIRLAWKTFGSYFAACLLLPITLGHLLPKKINENQFLTGTLLGVVGVTYWRLAPHTGFYRNIDELYVGILCTLAGILLPKLWRKEI